MKYRNVIEENKADVILIAETLLAQETITAEEITYLLEHRTLEGFGAVTVTEEPKAEEEAK